MLFKTSSKNNSNKAIFASKTFDWQGLAKNQNYTKKMNPNISNTTKGML